MFGGWHNAAFVPQTLRRGKTRYMTDNLARRGETTAHPLTCLPLAVFAPLFRYPQPRPFNLENIFFARPPDRSPVIPTDLLLTYFSNR
jgi:hypothetical protein